MEGEHGLRASLAMPDARQLAGMDKLELYFELGCPGDSDASEQQKAGHRCLLLR